MSEQRYEPLPGLLGLPRFVWRRTPRSARIALVLLAGAAIVGTAIAIPLIASAKRESAAEERRADAADKARAERRLRGDQAPRRGRAVHAPRAPEAARQAAITAALERAITADARACYRADRLPGPAVKSTACSADATQVADLQPAARRAGGAVLVCLAATTVSTRPDGGRFAVGFEFIAAANWRRATFTWCKTNPPPGEQFGGARRAEVQLERACVNPSR
jgi:hypothetical protein